jgi:hypothetical protein
MKNVRTIRKLRVLLIVFAILAASPASPAAGATEYDGKYTGQISCDILPGQTTKPLRTDFLLKIVDGRAQYEREVLQADSTQPKLPALVESLGQFLRQGLLKAAQVAAAAVGDSGP